MTSDWTRQTSDSQDNSACPGRDGDCRHWLKCRNQKGRAENISHLIPTNILAVFLLLFLLLLLLLLNICIQRHRDLSTIQKLELGVRYDSLFEPRFAFGKLEDTKKEQQQEEE